MSSVDDNVLLETSIPDLVLFGRGKVRDTWEIPAARLGRSEPARLLLMVTTDRISAFDVVMKQGVAALGKIRNRISLYWFEKFKSICPNHIFSADQRVCAASVDKNYREANDLLGRCVLVYPAQVFPVECVVRGYLAGSGWEDYRKTGQVCGIQLPPGLREAEKLAEPIFTPATKATIGHDENITFDQMVETIGSSAAEKLRDISLRLYREAAFWAEICGDIIIADTKFEFGVVDGQITVVDELLTPDSSRFWEKTTYKPGQAQPSFDKQPLRDWLAVVRWNKQPPSPDLPHHVVKGMQERYKEAYERLVGKIWPPNFN